MPVNRGLGSQRLPGDWPVDRRSRWEGRLVTRPSRPAFLGPPGPTPSDRLAAVGTCDLMDLDAKHPRHVVEHEEGRVCLASFKPLPEANIQPRSRACFLLGESRFVAEIVDSRTDPAKERRKLGALAPTLALLVRLALHDGSIGIESFSIYGSRRPAPRASRGYDAKPEPAA